MNEFIGADSGQVYRIIKTLGSGGQGTVYLVEDTETGNKFAAKWYKAHLSSDQQLKQIQELVDRGSPNCVEEGIHFIWPIECLKSNESASIGYLMRVIDTSRFHTVHQITDMQIRQPKLPILCKICRRLLTALEKLHSEGLAYCDINIGNIMVDPVNGDIVICDNDNVIVNNTVPPVLGMLDFMAPEVALGNSKPNADSDLYSVAVLIYFLWMWEHPMAGKNYYSLHCIDDIARKKFFAEHPLFVFHPHDNSNSIKGLDILELHVARWARMCPLPLKNMFIQVFTDGIYSAHKRPRLSQWQRVFAELETNAIICKCGALDLWVDGDETVRCYRCQERIMPKLIMRIDNGHAGTTSLPVSQGVKIYNYHLPAR